MARTDNLENFLTDVAAAIKAKKGDDTPIPAANFDTEYTNLCNELIGIIERTATSFEIPEGTASIGSYLFCYCTGLTSVTIPDSVTSIGDSAFKYCTGLTSINIPNSVTSISSGAFYNCYHLTSIAIPNSVTKINTSVFAYCSGLIEIDFSTHTTIPTLSSTNAFNNTSSSLVIKVPSALVDEWKTATNWSTYADKIVGV